MTDDPSGLLALLNDIPNSFLVVLVFMLGGAMALVLRRPRSPNQEIERMAVKEILAAQRLAMAGLRTDFDREHTAHQVTQVQVVNLQQAVDDCRQQHQECEAKNAALEARVVKLEKANGV